MPGYETPIKQGNALGIMCSYNSATAAYRRCLVRFVRNMNLLLLFALFSAWLSLHSGEWEAYMCQPGIAKSTS